jgi:hypothetical protein
VKPPSGPPSEPSDPFPLDVVVGTVKANSSGPCYLLETDDGKLYYLYYEAASRPTYAEGARVGAKIAALASSTCGQGQHLRVTQFL